MELKDVAGYLRITVSKVESLIQNGTPLPVSGNRMRLNAQFVRGIWYVEDADLDAFQAAFDSEEPGRHPPTWVMRTLRVESRHCCAICRGPVPLQFHHMLEWSRIKHYDPTQMLAVCGTCHDRIGRGEIDHREQLAYKERLRMGTADIQALDAQFQSLMATKNVFPMFGKLIETLTVVMNGSSSGDSVAHDYTHVSLEAKNALNRLSQDYFDLMMEEDDVHVTKIDLFLKDPKNEEIKKQYMKLASSLKERVLLYSSQGLNFEYCLMKLKDALESHLSTSDEIERRAMKALVTFMYVNCDIGKKR